MKKHEFLKALSEELSSLPDPDREESLAFYSEMLDERMEAGEEEDAAVAALGTPKEVARNTLLDAPFAKLLKQKYKQKRRFRTWEIVLLAIGSPIWVSLLAVVLSLVLTAYVLILSGLVTVYALYASLLGLALGFFFSGGRECLFGMATTGLLYFGCGFFSLGLFATGALVCKKATQFFISVTRALTRALKLLLIGRGKEK